jgi:hypothetical protein
MLKCSWAHTLSCLFMYCSFANIWHANIMWSTLSSNCNVIKSEEVGRVPVPVVSFPAVSIFLPLLYA